MTRKKAVAWMIIFIASIVIFPLLLLMTKQAETENQEYREMTQLPTLSGSTIEEWISLLDDYVDDHIPNRSKLVKWKSLLDMELLGTSASDEVVVGKDGWMFLQESVDWYRGETLYTREELDTIVKKLSHVSEQMKQMGGEFVLFIAPGKPTIYPEYLPELIGEKSYNKTEQLIDALEENHIKYLFPVDQISNYKDTMQLYAKRDTHWNSLGAYIGSYEINQFIGAHISAVEELEIYPKVYEGEDLSRLMNLAGYWGAEEDYDFVGYAPGRVLTLEGWDATGNSQWYSTTGAETRKVYLVRDSFGSRMTNFVAAGSSDTCVRHLDLFYAESIAEEAPDYFILELVERRLDGLLSIEFE